MADVMWHPEAQVEYTAAVAWYHSRSPRAAVRFESEVERVLGVIGDNPDLYPKYDDDHRFAVLRRYPYSIVYQVLPAYVFVVALAHAGRSPGYWRDRT